MEPDALTVRARDELAATSTLMMSPLMKSVPGGQGDDSVHGVLRVVIGPSGYASA
jgi:hypothetical protein